MKNVIASVGAIVIGLTAMQGAMAQQATVENAKSLDWLSASLSVRGIYDDNIYGNSNYKKDSFGFKVAPSVGLKYQNDTTLARVNYEYGYTYFADRQSPKADQSHLVDAVFSHAFTDRLRLDVKDSFAVAQEPESITDLGGGLFLGRASGNNLRNIAEINVGVMYSENCGIEVGYKNAFWDFSDESYAFVLNRMEHTPHIDFFFDIDDINRVFVGYQYNLSKYNQNGIRYIGWGGIEDIVGGLPYESDIFDRQSHFGYAGYRLTLDKGLDWTTRVGAQYTEWKHANDYNNAYDLGLRESKTSPFAESVIDWTYMENCKASLGVRHEVGASQWGAMCAEMTTVYAGLAHAFDARVTAYLNAAYQHSSYESSPYTGTVADDRRDDYFTVAPRIAYRFSGDDWPVATFVELGYTYDNLHSNMTDRSYDRNRAFVGVRASY